MKKGRILSVHFSLQERREETQEILSSLSSPFYFVDGKIRWEKQQKSSRKETKSNEVSLLSLPVLEQFKERGREKVNPLEWRQ